MDNREDLIYRLTRRLAKEMGKHNKSLMIRVSPKIFEVAKNFDWSAVGEFIIGTIHRPDGITRAINRLTEEEKIIFVVEQKDINRIGKIFRTVEIRPAEEMGAFGVNIRML